MDFDSIFGMFGNGGQSLPGLGGVMASNPELLASTAAANGVPPPQLPPAGSMGGGGPNDSPYPDVGASLNPAAMPPAAPSFPGGQVPLPTARPAAAGPGAAALDANASAAKPPGNALLDTLRGIKAPAVPEVPKAGTSAGIPRGVGGQVKSGNIEALLAQLGMSGARPQGLALPSTLGAALGGR